MRILLLGKNGQVGRELARSLAPLGQLTALGRDSDTELSADLEWPDELRRTIRQIQPDAIVNAAAYTAVDQAESEPEQAELINATAPGVLAEEANQLGALLVHYSTDYIFDGTGTKPWQEASRPAPINTYGATKWRGEQAVRSATDNHLIFRTQWVYATHGKNFIRTMLRLAAERDELQVIEDQVGAPTGAELIADVTAHALRCAVPWPNPTLPAPIIWLPAAKPAGTAMRALSSIPPAKLAGRYALLTRPSPPLAAKRFQRQQADLTTPGWI